MIRQSLRTFVTRVLRSRRITFRDVQVLQRDVLADGLSSREEAEALIALDQAVRQSHPAWAGCLVGLVVEWTVWSARPTGYVDAETAGWLVGWLSSPNPSRSLVRIGREILSEAQDVDAALRTFVDGRSRRRPSASATIAAHAP